MRFGACVPGSVATTFTISTGFGTRRCGCWMKESNSTFRPPPAALLHASSSDLIQRRAAPMPCVSESVRESVWRVWKETSLRMRASIRAGWMAATIASICALRCWAAQGSAARSVARARLALMRARRLVAKRGGTVLLRAQAAVERVEVGVDDGHHYQGEKRGGNHA